MTTSPQSGMKNGLVVTAVKDRKLRVELVSNGKNCGHFETPAANAALLVVQILLTAKIAQEQSQQPPAQATQTNVIAPSKIGLAPCDIPGHEALTVQFGDAAFGIALEKSSLRQFAEALMALSASDDKAQ